MNKISILLPSFRFLTVTSYEAGESNSPNPLSFLIQHRLITPVKQETGSLTRIELFVKRDSVSAEQKPKKLSPELKRMTPVLAASVLLCLFFWVPLLCPRQWKLMDKLVMVKSRYFCTLQTGKRWLLSL